MAVFNFGSINIDEVFGVDHIVRPGETLATQSFQKFTGGKGANQSIALSRAGVDVIHIGSVGQDGDEVRQLLADNGVDVSQVTKEHGPTGRALIQVGRDGENSIIILPGANALLTPERVNNALDKANPGDWVLVQNETNATVLVIEEAHRRGLPVVFNPSPLTPEVLTFPLHKVTLLVLNQTEAEALVGRQAPAQELVQELVAQSAQQTVVLTLGAHGALLGSNGGGIQQVEGLTVPVLDTTAAGDTFLGYLVAGYLKGAAPAVALGWANRAAALAVTRRGAAPSIPTWQQMLSSPLLPH